MRFKDAVQYLQPEEHTNSIPSFLQTTQTKQVI